jgi:hypothetical protein
MLPRGPQARIELAERGGGAGLDEFLLTFGQDGLTATFATTLAVQLAGGVSNDPNRTGLSYRYRLCRGPRPAPVAAAGRPRPPDAGELSVRRGGHPHEPDLRRSAC